jgi:hypothetical protein
MAYFNISFVYIYICNHGAGVAQSVYCLTIDWTTGVQSLAEAKYFFFSLCVQTISEIHPVSYPLGTWGGPFPGVNASGE